MTAPSVLAHCRDTFTSQRRLAEKAIAQCSDAQLFHQPTPDENSIAIVANHIAGNLLSRWTDFLTSDGEKPWRDRDTEFEPPPTDRDALMARWADGWQTLDNALAPLTDDDLFRPVTIRGEAHHAIQAILRQIAHYGYHVGQIVTLARAEVGTDWRSLSIPKGQSNQFNRDFANRKPTPEPPRKP